MSTLERVNKFVVSYCELAEAVDIPESHWLNQHGCDAYVEAHLEDDEEDSISIWLKENYPELIDEESFFIHLDY